DGTCYMCRTGNAHVCKSVSIVGIDRDGAFAEYLKVPASNVIVNDPDLPPEFATMQDPLGNAVYTTTNANVPGKTVAIFGLGPIGLMAVALCRAMGARRVIAVGHRNQYRMNLAKTVGAHSVLRSGPRLVEEIMNLRPLLTHKFSLDRYDEAMDVMRSGDCGKVAFPMEA